MDDSIYIGAKSGGAAPQSLLLNRANRHGLIAGATGTGKTVTLQGLAEGFSAAGVPVFLADVKGDLAGIAMAGSPTAKIHPALAARAEDLALTDWSYGDNPAILWDLFGQAGHPIRTTISEMGPLLLARLMSLNEVQEGVLNIAFKLADEQGLLLLDLGDLQALLQHCAENAGDLSARYGNVTRSSVGAIQRQLLQLESQGAESFFGEPALDVQDFMRVDETGRGYLNILAADRLMASPRLYATFLLWLLSELFERLPEVGDPAKPKLVFFFDEAHLLFEDGSAALESKIEQVVRLIRSKGVGVYFVTQNPIDVPDKVAAHRIQHALRAFTPRDQKAVRSAAETFRPNPPLDVESAISQLKVGEALVSLLDAEGAPTPVERVLIKPPRSRVGPLEERERAAIRMASPVEGVYEETIDRESAEEVLKSKGEAAASAAARAREEAEFAKADAAREKAELAARREAEREQARVEREARAHPSFEEQMLRQVGRSFQRQAANKVAGSLLRGLLGGLFR